jgi:hypothetical protein
MYCIFLFRPTEYQTVWRGVSEDLSTSYTRGKEFTWWAVSSCTSAISVLESPLYVGTSGPRTIFSIESSSGKSIRGISYFQHEDEILLPPGRYLKVIDKSSPAPNLHIIHLREIQPPYPMLADPFDLNNLKQIPQQPNTVPIPPIVENKQESNPPPTIIVIPKPVPPPPIVEKKQENNPPTASDVPKPAVEVTAQKGKSFFIFSIYEKLVTNYNYFGTKLYYSTHPKTGCSLTFCSGLTSLFILTTAYFVIIVYLICCMRKLFLTINVIVKN